MGTRQSTENQEDEDHHQAHEEEWEASEVVRVDPMLHQWQEVDEEGKCLDDEIQALFQLSCYCMSTVTR